MTDTTQDPAASGLCVQLLLLWAQSRCNKDYSWGLMGSLGKAQLCSERLQVKGHLAQPTLKWRRHKYSLYKATPIPQEDRKEFSEKRIRKGEGGKVAGGGQRK